METNKIYQGDALKILKTLPNESVNCCITSPPYYGLRDYGVDGQIGLEQTPEEYISKMTAVFREIRRVLKKDGTCWLNIGDSYATKHKSGTIDENTGWRSSGNEKNPRQKQHGRANGGDLEPKNIIGIPWRVAFALQSDGWYLRQDIIWAKPNPMPESVTDRCTRSHEYIFLLTKSKKYYFNQLLETAKYTERWGVHKKIYNEQQKNGLDNNNSPDRNKRDVWTVNTEPCPEAHFAVFPTALIEPMILAGCPEGGVVLDPFMGAGTTAVVSYRLNRKYIGIELNPEYIKIVEKRLSRETIPLF